jgi:hypothetical protein
MGPGGQGGQDWKEAIQVKVFFYHFFEEFKYIMYIKSVFETVESPHDLSKTEEGRV